MREVVAIGQKIQGRSYSEWSAEWWKWALELPAVPNHPFYDDPAFDVMMGQPPGNVWFLAAPFGTSQRTIAVPQGTFLFVALINSEASNLEFPPFFGCTESELAGAAKVFTDYVQSAFLRIDGKRLPDAFVYRFTSPLFSFVLPNLNILGIPPGTVTTCSPPNQPPMAGNAVSDGYWAMIRPMSLGQHTLRFGGEFVNTPFGDIPVDVTYNITVY